jgi:hypothetical protein
MYVNFVFVQVLDDPSESGCDDRDETNEDFRPYRLLDRRWTLELQTAEETERGRWTHKDALGLPLGRDGKLPNAVSSANIFIPIIS